MTVDSPALYSPVARPVPPRIRRRSIKAFGWHIAMLALLLLQISSGTQPTFAFLVFLFGLLTYLAVKACGGLFTLTGFSVFYLAMQNLIISQVVKVAYWTPADINIQRPIETLTVLNLTMLGIYMAALATGLAARRVKVLKRPPLFDAEINLERLYWLAIVSTIFSIFQSVYSATQTLNADTGAANTGGIHGLLHAITYLSPLAVASGTAYLILSSRGRKSFGVINGMAMAIPCLFGIIGAGRQQMTTTIIIYYVTCFLFRFKFRPIHFAIILAGAYICQFILFPYALYARQFTRTARVEDNMSRAANLLGDVIADPLKYQTLTATSTKSFHSHRKFLYYGKPSPTLDRFSLVIITGGIVDATLRSGTIGMTTIRPGFEMAVPRLVAPDKAAGYRNTLAHREPGMVGKDDYTTGISTGFASDSFSSYGWLGAFAIPFILCVVLFCAFRFVVRDRLWGNIYAISLVFYLPWRFSETNIAQVIVLILQGCTFMIIILFLIKIVVNSFINLSRRLRRASRREGLNPHVGRALRSQGRIGSALYPSYLPAPGQSFAQERNAKE